MIASVFTSPEGWHTMDEEAYQSRKQALLTAIRQGVNAALDLPDHAWLHQELATPRGFARWTGRPEGLWVDSGKVLTVLVPSAWPVALQLPTSGCAEIQFTLGKGPQE